MHTWKITIRWYVLSISSFTKAKVIAVSQTSNFHILKGKRKKLLWAKQGNRLLFPLLACGESFSMVLLLHTFFFFFPSQSIKSNSIVSGLRENWFLFRGFLLYILSGNRYVKNNSRIHTIPANESASAFTGLWSTESFRQMNSLEGFSCNICNAHPSTK